MFARFPLVVVFVLGLTSACVAELRTDGSSKDAFERSIKAMADSLSPQERSDFGRALLRAAIAKYPPASGTKAFARLSLMPEAMENAHIHLADMTIAEIRAAADYQVEADPKVAVPTRENSKQTASCVTGGAGSNKVLTVSDWRISLSENQISNQYRVTATITPVVEQPFRYMDGTIHFTDAFGDDLVSLRLEKTTVSDGVAPIEHDGYYYAGRDFKTLADMNRADVTATVCVRRVVSRDGKAIDYR